MAAASPLPLTPARAALAVTAIGFAAIAGALFIEHVLGVLPCELCLKQRIPYYAGVPLGLIAAWQAARSPRGSLTAGLLLLLAVVFAVGAGMGIYHSGVEFGWWQGPTDCSGDVGKTASLGDFLKSLETAKVVRCDEVAMRILGLSLAAWNAVLCVALTLLALLGARSAARA